MNATPLLKKQNYNYPVNGLRGLCILMIFLYHIINSGLIPAMPQWGTTFLYYISSFRYGVELFFMISGYVIVGSLRKHATISAFLADRALRIFPAWAPLLLLLFVGETLAGYGIFAHIDPLRWAEYFLANLFFLTPALVPVPLIHPAAWSLNYEWIFYLLASGAAVLAHSRLCKTGSAWIIGMLAACMITLYPRGLFFVPGIIAALQEDWLKAHSRLFRFPLLFLFLFLLFWRMTNVDHAELDTTLAEWLQDGRIVWAILAFTTGFYMFCGLVLDKGWLPQRLCASSFQFLGQISYSFYLWSPLVMFPVKRFVSHFIIPLGGIWSVIAVFTIVSFFLSVLVSWVSWRYLEKGLTRQIRQLLHAYRQPPYTHLLKA